MGTCGGALETRQIAASGGCLVEEAVGEIELENNVLVIRRIHVRLKLKAGERDQETANRVHGVYADKCPIYLSLKAAIT